MSVNRKASLGLSGLLLWMIFAIPLAQTVHVAVPPSQSRIPPGFGDRVVFFAFQEIDDAGA